MTQPNSWNQRIIDEFHANAGKVGGPFEGATMLLLTSTGARTGRQHITPLVYLPDGDRYVVIASKGIYASHYFEASLGLTALVHGPAADPSHTYLIYLNRSRADGLRGPLSGMKRALIGSSLREGARKNMDIIRQRLESEYHS